MGENFHIKIENLLRLEKREIKVSHSSADKEVTLGYEVSTSNHFQLVPAEGDHLLMEIVGAAVLDRNCWIRLPERMNVMFIPQENQPLEYINTKKGMFLKIPPGPPTWKLKITIPSWISPHGKPIEDNVTISDDKP